MARYALLEDLFPFPCKAPFAIFQKILTNRRQRHLPAAPV